MSDEVSLSKGWSLEAYISHNEALRDAEGRFASERDRRYTEVALEREKALKIKETADLAALGLAREIQTYKDEKANQLREQISSERGLYPTKDDLKGVEAKMDAKIDPLAAFMLQRQGSSIRGTSTVMYVIAAFGILGTLAGIVGTIIAAVALLLTRGTN